MGFFYLYLVPRVHWGVYYEPFGLSRFATDRCCAPQVNGRYAALLLALSTMEDVIYIPFYHFP